MLAPRPSVFRFVSVWRERIDRLTGGVRKLDSHDRIQTKATRCYINAATYNGPPAGRGRTCRSLRPDQLGEHRIGEGSAPFLNRNWVSGLSVLTRRTFSVDRRKRRHYLKRSLPRSSSAPPDGPNRALLAGRPTPSPLHADLEQRQGWGSTRLPTPQAFISSLAAAAQPRGAPRSWAGGPESSAAGSRRPALYARTTCSRVPTWLPLRHRTAPARSTAHPR